MDTENGEEIVLEDDDLLVELSEEEVPEEEFSWEDDTAADEGTRDAASRNAEVEPARDPLSTATLAELYVSQGFLKRAVTIYRELLETEPDNEHLKQRMVELKEAVDRDQVSAREHALDDLSPEGAAVSTALPPIETVEAGSTDSVLRTLEQWLANIGRRR